jgi:hypothetical protein
MKALINPDHHAVTAVLGTGAGVDDLGHHHPNTTIVHSINEPKDLSLPRKHTTMKMTKRRWERDMSQTYL